MGKKICLGLFLVGLFLTFPGYSQVTDLTWTGFDLKIPLDSKSTLDLKPIIRHNLDGDGYQNTSLDIFYKRTFDKGYFAQALTRTWYLKNATYRLFLWLDVGKTWKYDKVNFTQKFRLHYAVDVGDNFDGDFIRSFSVLTIPINSSLKATFNLEPWLSLNDDIEISRYRIEPGLSWKMSDQLSLAFVYRWQSDFRLDPVNNQNHYVTTLSYQLQTGKVVNSQ